MKTFIITLTILILGLLGFTLWKGASDYPSVDTTVLQDSPITVYKTPTCGCCGNYVSYLEQNGLSVEVINMTDLSSIKEQYGVPDHLESCHTTLVGDYVVEGHIPLEAIVKLQTEKPAIEGIAMPGMPSGSPGMPGTKAPFIIYQLDGLTNQEIFLKM